MMSGGPNLEQYQIVDDLLNRQEDVLQQLEALENRIEAQIKAVTNSRERVESAEDSGSLTRESFPKKAA